MEFDQSLHPMQETITQTKNHKVTKKLTLSIPKPCHEDWDKMTTADKGRFCGSCQKDVIDFTSMSEGQLIAFFKKPKGSVCGRFRNDQLEKDIYLRPKRMPWVKYFFRIVIPVFLLSCKQRTIGKVKPETLQDAYSTTYATTGIVLSEFPVQVMDSTVSVKGEINKMEKIDTSGVIFGDLKVDTTALADEIVDTSALQLPEVIIEGGKTIHCSQTINYGINSIMGDVVAGVTVENVYDSIENKNRRSESKLKVYPNPLRRNTNAKADPGKLPAGEYIIQVADMSGKILYSNRTVTDKFTLVEIPFSGLPGGMYILRFQNEKSGKIFTEKVVVQ